MRRALIARPPDLPRIHELAGQLAAGRSLQRIANREALLRYIELYMLRCLLAAEGAAEGVDKDSVAAGPGRP